MKHGLRGFRRTITLGLVLVMVAACSGGVEEEPGTTGSEAGTTDTTVASTTSTSSEPDTDSPDDAFQAEWDALVSAAQEEGELVLVGSTNHQEGEGEVYELFGETYGIDVSMIIGSSSEIQARLFAEIAQGVYSADVLMAGTSGQTAFIEAGYLAPLEPLLIHPDISDRSLWHVEEFPWLPTDVDKMYTSEWLLRIEPNLFRIHYNTETVSEDEIAGVTSYSDFVEDPRWQDRIVTSNVATADGVGADMARAWTVLGGEWFDMLYRDQGAEAVGDGQQRQLVDGLARGEWDVTLLSSNVTGDVIEAIDQGLPLAQLTRTLEEGPWVDLTGHFSILESAPNPAAAQLFANWLLTYDAQYAFNEFANSDVRPGVLALRSDIPQVNRPDDDWAALQSPGFQIIIQDAEQANAAREESQAYIGELFSELGITP